MAWLEAHHYSAMQIVQRLRSSGYQGGVTIVRDYVRQVRPPSREAFLTLSFAPGEAAQVDWGEYGTIQVGSTRRRLSFFVMVLCHSRMMYVEFFVSQQMEHFLSAHLNAFAAFGGCPRRVIVDNLKSAVLQRLVGAAPVFNPRYADFARHCGFGITACSVGKGNEKDYASYCTSFAPSGRSFASRRRCDSLAPWVLRGPSSPGGSNNDSFLSL